MRCFSILGLALASLMLFAAMPRHAAAYQQCANVLIASPRSGATARGDVEIIGSASIDRFQFYKVEFSPLNNPDSWSAVSQTVRRPVVNARLDVWNTRAIGDGLYNLKLTVVDDRAQEVCRAVVTQLQVANRVAPPTATEDQSPTPEASSTARTPTPATSTTPGVTATVPPLPTIPPPPTVPGVTPAAAVAQPAAAAPTAAPTRSDGTAAPAATARPGSSLIPDLSGVRQTFSSAFDFGRIRDAFLLGAIGTIAVFTFIGLVLLLRRLL